MLGYFLCITSAASALIPFGDSDSSSLFLFSASTISPHVTQKGFSCIALSYVRIVEYSTYRDSNHEPTASCKPPCKIAFKNSMSRYSAKCVFTINFFLLSRTETRLL